MIASPGAMTGRLSLAATTAAMALMCAALALWVSFGALSFVDADDRGAYVGVLPPLVWLAALLVAAGAVTIVARPSPRQVAPLWLSAVALLPWLPVPMPLIGLHLDRPSPDLAVGGHCRGAGRAGHQSNGSLGCTRAAAAEKRRIARRDARGGRVRRSAHGPWRRSIRTETSRTISSSRRASSSDRDLKIENNHRQGDYRAYVSRPLKPDFLKRGKDGQIYSIHAPGLPLIVAPAFALFGYPGVLVGLCLVSAAASALAWLVAWRVTGDQAASWFGWAAVALSVPFFFHASALFPDGLGAVLTLVALLPLVDRARARATTVWLRSARRSACCPG